MDYQQKLEFVILGIPGSKQSTQFTKLGIAYTPKDKKQKQENVAWEIKSKLPKHFVIHVGPVKVTYDFVFPIPKSFSKKLIARIESGEVIYKVSKPDTDNLVKPAKDAMNGVVFLDDSQVVVERARKMYGKTPMTIISVELYSEQI